MKAVEENPERCRRQMADGAAADGEGWSGYVSSSVPTKLDSGAVAAVYARRTVVPALGPGPTVRATSAYARAAEAGDAGNRHSVPARHRQDDAYTGDRYRLVTDSAGGCDRQRRQAQA